jgi:hypothetical protein
MTLNLNTVQRSRGRADPWAEIDQMLGKYAKNVGMTMWQSSEFRMPVKFGKSRAVLKVEVDRFFTGAIKSLRIESTVVRPTAKDPTGFDYAVSIRIDRGHLESATECRAYIDYISKKPSHGVFSGGDAIGIALGICRLIRCDTVEVSDASSLPCGTEKVSLRRFRILSRGSGWYESKGFKSAAEVLGSAAYRRTIAKLHKLPLPQLIEKMTGIDAIVRSAIASPDRDVVRRMVVAKHDMTTEQPELISPPSVEHLASILANVSVALEVMRDSKATIGTLGALMDRVMAADCLKARALVNALLPWEDVYFVIMVGPDGRPAPKLPQLKAWLFAWRASKMNPLTMMGRDAMKN